MKNVLFKNFMDNQPGCRFSDMMKLISLLLGMLGLSNIFCSAFTLPLVDNTSRQGDLVDEAAESFLNLNHLVKGTVTRLYPSEQKYYFHTSGDKEPYGFSNSDYNVFEIEKHPHLPNLLLEAAKNNWPVVVRRAGEDGKVQSLGGYAQVQYAYVDFPMNSE